MMLAPQKIDLSTPAEATPVSRRFTIPKKLETDGRREILLNSREFQLEVYPMIQQAYTFPESHTRITINRVFRLHNQNLIDQFTKRKGELASCRTEKELTESYAFFGTKLEGMVSGICKSGMRMSNISATHCNLGNTKMGVTLQKYADVLWCKEPEKGMQHFMIVHRVIKGRVKLVPENSNHLEPTPNYDCHMSKQITALNKCDLTSLFWNSQIYFYEYSDDGEIVKPRLAYPTMLLFYHYDSVPSVPKSILPTNKLATKSNVPQSHSVPIWNGKILNQGLCIGTATMVSYAMMFKPSVFGKSIDLIQSLPFEQFRAKVLRLNHFSVRREMHLKSGFLVYTQIRAAQSSLFKELTKHLVETGQVAVWYAGKRVEAFVVPDLPCLHELGFPSLSRSNFMAHCIFYAPYSMASRLKVHKKRLHMEHETTLSTNTQNCSAGLLGETPDDSSAFSVKVSGKDFDEGFKPTCSERSMLSSAVVHDLFNDISEENEKITMFKELEAATDGLMATPCDSQADYYSSLYPSYSHAPPPLPPPPPIVPFTQGVYNSVFSYEIPPVSSYADTYVNQLPVVVPSNTIIMESAANTAPANHYHQSSNTISSLSILNNSVQSYSSEGVYSAQPKQLQLNEMHILDDGPLNILSSINSENNMEGVKKQKLQTSKGESNKDGIDLLHQNTRPDNTTELPLVSQQDKNAIVNTSSISAAFVNKEQKHLHQDVPKSLCELKPNQMVPSADVASIKPLLNSIEIDKQNLVSIIRDVISADHSNRKDALQTKKRKLSMEGTCQYPENNAKDSGNEEQKDLLQTANGSAPKESSVQLGISSSSENISEKTTHTRKSDQRHLIGKNLNGSKVPYMLKPLVLEGKKSSPTGDSPKDLNHSPIFERTDKFLQMGTKHSSEIEGSNSPVINPDHTPPHDNFFSKVGSNWESPLLRQENENIPFLNNVQEPSERNTHNDDDETSNYENDEGIVGLSEEKGVELVQTEKTGDCDQSLAETESHADTDKGDNLQLIIVDVEKKPMKRSPDIMKLLACDTSCSSSMQSSLSQAMQQAMKNFSEMQSELLRNQLKLKLPVCTELPSQNTVSSIQPGDKVCLHKLSSFSTIFNEIGNETNRCEAIDELKEEVTKFTEGIMTKIANSAVTGTEIATEVKAQPISNADLRKRSLSGERPTHSKRAKMMSEDTQTDRDLLKMMSSEEKSCVDEVIHEEMDRFYDVFSMFLCSGEQPDANLELNHHRSDFGKMSLSKLRILKEYGNCTEADKFIDYTVKAGIKQFLFMLDKLLNLLQQFPFEENEKGRKQKLGKNTADVQKQLLYDKIVSVVSKLTKDISSTKGKPTKDKAPNAVLAKRCFTTLNKICSPNPKIDEVVDKMTIKVEGKLNSLVQDEPVSRRSRTGRVDSGHKTDTLAESKNNVVVRSSKASPSTRNVAANTAVNRDGKLKTSGSSKELQVGRLAHFIANQALPGVNKEDNRTTTIEQVANVRRPGKQSDKDAGDVKHVQESTKSLWVASSASKPTVGSRKVYKCIITNKRKLFLKKKKLHLERYQDYRKNLLQFVLMSKKVKKLAYTTAICSKLRPKYQKIRRRRGSGKILLSLRNVMLKVNEFIERMCHSKRDFTYVWSLHRFELSALFKKLAKDFDCGSVHASTLKLVHHVTTTALKDCSMTKQDDRLPLNCPVGAKDIRSTKCDVSIPVCLSRPSEVSSLTTSLSNDS